MHLGFSDMYAVRLILYMVELLEMPAPALKEVLSRIWSVLRGCDRLNPAQMLPIR